MSKSGYSDIELLEYIDKHFDEIEFELNREECKEPKKLDRYFCMGCKLRKIVDYERSTLVCKKCGVFEYICIDNPLIHQAHKGISPWYQHRVVSLRSLWWVERILVLPKSALWHLQASFQLI